MPGWVLTVSKEDDEPRTYPFPYRWRLIAFDRATGLEWSLQDLNNAAVVRLTRMVSELRERS